MYCAPAFYQKPTLTLATLLILAINVNPLPTLKDLHLRCQTHKDCHNHDPNKDCFSGRCYCKPDFDDTSAHNNDFCMRSYEAHCDSQRLCNVHKYLTCHKEKEICVCENEEEMEYDAFLGKCVARLGEECELNEYAGVKKECGRYATCVEDFSRETDSHFFGICDCDKGYFDQGDKCVPLVGSPCEMDSDCNNDGVLCVNKFCTCPSDKVFNEEDQSCRLRIGTNCEDLEDSCTDNAHCDFKSTGDAKWGLECVCDLGFYANSSSGTCVREWHDKCSEEMGNWKVYEAERERCSTKVGGPCESREFQPHFCVQHAFCGTGSKCQCYDEYEVTAYGTCEKNANSLEAVEEKRVQSSPPPQSAPFSTTDDQSSSEVLRFSWSINILVLLITLSIL